MSETAGPIIRKFCVQIPCGRGSVLLRQRCTTLNTFGFMDDVTFGHMVLHGWPGGLQIGMSFVRDWGGV